jgi:hypothetical protein
MFDFIIESGICKNIIGKHISKTIKLQLEANLKPYKICRRYKSSPCI